MKYVWIGVAIVALLVILFYRSSVEHMTNEDLMDTLKTFGEKGTPPSKKDKKKRGTPTNEEPIYGPKIPKQEEPSPADSKKKQDTSSTYPDIYGPEITPVPGAKKCKGNGKSSSDMDTYCFNADLDGGFPREEDEPQPFLTDFSKFQH